MLIFADAVSDTGDDDLAAGHHHGARGGAPALLHLGPGLGVKTVEPPPILAQINATKRLGIYVEPGVAYYFNDGSDIQTIRKENPFNFNIQAGVRLTY